MITHRSAFDDFVEVYDVFADPVLP
jgi:hypothetical protein